MKTWKAPEDLASWSLADLIRVRDVLRMMARWEEARILTEELRRRGFTA